MKRVLRWTALGGLAVSYSYCLWHTITSHVITAVVVGGVFSYERKCSKSKYLLFDQLQLL